MQPQEFRRSKLLCLALSSLIFLMTIFLISLQFENLSLIQSFPYSIIVTVGVQCTLYGLLSFLNIGFNGILSNIFNILICIGCAYSAIRKQRKKEPDGEPQCKPTGNSTLSLNIRGFLISIGSRKDIISLVAGFGFIVFLTIMHYGTTLSLSFLSGDSASHFSSMRSLADGSLAKGQYLFAMTGALMIDALRFLIDPVDFSKIYVINELFWCWLSMQMLYSILSVITTKLNTALCILLCWLFAFGYPFCSAIIGFGYFGASSAVICALFFAIANRPLTGILDLAVVSILLIEIAVGYILFVPPVFLAVFLVLLFPPSIPRRKLSQRLGICVLVFALPCILGVFVSYSAFFGFPTGSASGATSQTMLAAISQDGGTFKNLYANFIFIAPLGIYGFIMKAVRRDSFMRLGLFPSIFLAYCGAVFLLCLFSIVSPYYFYKTYAVLWFLFFVFGAIGIEYLLSLSIKALASYACVWIVLLVFAMGGLDSKLSEKRPDIDPTPIAESLFPLYRFNIDSTGAMIIDRDSYSEFKSASTDFNESDTTALLGENESRWFGALGFEGNRITWWKNRDQGDTLKSDILSELSDSEYVYIDDTFYTARPYPDFDYESLDETAQYVKDNYDEVFETDYGTVYKKR